MKKTQNWVTDVFMKNTDVKHPISFVQCEILNAYSIISTDAKWIIISPQNIEQNDIDIPVDLLKPTMVKCSMERQWYFECIF